MQILKHLFDSDRPASVFEQYHDKVLPVVEGVDLYHSNSFPSGHASTFFVFFTCCAILLACQRRLKAPYNNPTIWCRINLAMLGLLIMAALGAFSRVYLSQHFLSDVCVGSIIGVVSPCLVFHFIKNKIVNSFKESVQTR